MNWKLTLEKVNQIFKNQNPTGYITREKNTFRVVFSENGKVYNYKAKNLLGLCVKLDIVPEPDIVQEADRLESLMRDGQEVIGLTAALDTLRWLVRDITPSGHIVDYEEIGINEWNETMGCFFFKESKWA